MLQLIITIIAIALTSALLAASVNYIPWWYKQSTDVDAVLRAGLPVAEQAYDVVTRANNGVPPAVTADADGGWSANFQPVLKLLPPAPTGFVWKYGKNQAGVAPWNGLNYFCLDYTREDLGAGEGVWRGVRKAQSVFSQNQMIVSDQCGDTTNSAPPTSYPKKVAITFYVAYTPGISK